MSVQRVRTIGKAAARGMTLIEIMVVLVILGLIAGAIGYNVFNQLKEAQIRTATLDKIPYMIIVGDREEKEGKISVRARDGKDLGAGLTVEGFLSKLNDEIVSRRKKLGDLTRRLHGVDQ